MKPRISERSMRWFLTVAVVGMLLIAWLLVDDRPKKHLLRTEYIGLTNYPGQRLPMVLYAVTNPGGTALIVDHLVEVNTAGWPVYGPHMQATWHSWGTLPPHQSMTLAVMVPDYGSAWRVRISYAEVFTKWDTMRSSWAASLHTRKLHRVARLIWRGKPCREILMPEMKI